MKIKVDVDCSPEELRTFFGLPDMAPMQKAIMDQMQSRMLSEMDNWSPSGLMRDWFAPAAGMQQAMMRMFATSRDDEEPPAE